MLKHLMAELIFMRGKGLSDSKFNKKYHLVHIMLLYVILCNKYASWYKFVLGVTLLLVGRFAIPDMRVSG